MNKKLIAILTLVMFALTLLPMGAFAATTNSVILYGTVTDGTNKTLNSRIRIQEPSTSVGSLATGGLVTFTINGNAEISSPSTVAALDPTFVVATSANIAADVVSLTKKSFTVQIGNTNTASAGSFDLDFSKIRLNTTGATGPIVLDITAQGAGVTEGSITIGEVLGGRTNASVISTKKFSIDSNGQPFGSIRISEVAAGAFGSGASNVGYVKLPADMSWATAPTPTVYGGGLTAANFTVGIGPKDGYSALIITANQVSAGSKWNLELVGGTINVTKDAPLGDVKVTLDDRFTSQTLVVGNVVEYGVTVSEDTTKTLYAGQSDEKIGNFIIEESAVGSILPSRNIRLTLPTNVIWTAAPSLDVISGDGTTLPASITSISTDARELTFSITGPTTGSPLKLRLKEGKVAINADAKTGDLMVEVSGPAGVTGEVKVATIVAPVTVTSAVSDVQIGKQAQEVADITITEAAKGLFQAGKNIDIMLPTSFSFNGTPVATLVEGDATIENVSKVTVGTTPALRIQIKRTSTVPSTIKITGIKVDLDRTVAEGPYDFKVTGNSLNMVAADATAPALYAPTTIATKSESAVSDAAFKFVGATVVTPAGENVVKPVVMTVGSTVYSISGVEMTMDVAPYIKDGRTYFPVRYVAQALGITADNVVWDGAQRTVTIFRANRIVQVTIGSTTMLVNGVPLTMDAAPEITAERTMLPIRFVAQGLGVNVNWDAATQTVTLN